MNPATKKHLTSPRAKDRHHLPRFEFPSEDESQPDANKRGLLWLLLHIVARVALEIAQYAAFRFTSGLSHWTFCLTVRALPNTIWCGR